MIFTKYFNVPAHDKASPKKKKFSSTSKSKENTTPLYKCGLCHVACRDCTGPKISQCTACRSLQLGDSCVEEKCPFLYFEQENPDGPNRCTVPNSVIVFFCTVAIFILWLLLARLIRKTLRARKTKKLQSQMSLQISGSADQSTLNAYALTDRTQFHMSPSLSLGSEPPQILNSAKIGGKTSPNVGSAQFCWLEPVGCMAGAGGGRGVLVGPPGSVGDMMCSADELAILSSSSVSPSFSGGYCAIIPAGNTMPAINPVTPIDPRLQQHFNSPPLSFTSGGGGDNVWNDDSLTSSNSVPSYEVTV